MIPSDLCKDFHGVSQELHAWIQSCVRGQHPGVMLSLHTHMRFVDVDAGGLFCWDGSLTRVLYRLMSPSRPLCLCSNFTIGTLAVVMGKMFLRPVEWGAEGQTVLHTK